MFNYWTPRRIFLHGYWARDGSLSWAVRLKEEPILLDAHLPGYRLKERNALRVDRLVPSSSDGDIVEGKVWDCNSWQDLLMLGTKVGNGYRVKLEPVQVIINNAASPIQTYAFVWDDDWANPDNEPVMPRDTPLDLHEKTIPFFFHDSILQDVLDHLGPLKYSSQVAHIAGYKPTTFGSRCGLVKPSLQKGHQVDTKIRSKGRVCKLTQTEEEELEQYIEGVFTIEWLFIEVDEGKNRRVAGCLFCRDDEQVAQEID
ncbi:hypothetical protein MPER_12637 [Moniliophthora perniciosa FA553]|nr:hypothetical protein MPER_12637 [Moniliophthora perniciosa FA553]